jgi:hypothetical protein
MGQNCCGKRDKNDGALTNLGGLSTAEIAHSLEYINKFFRLHQDSNVIVLVYSKDQLKNFIASLSKIIFAIKSLT